MVNSRLSLVTATPFRSRREAFHGVGVPLLPKLRGHFAEFLLQSYPERLRLLVSSTCVRLRYGHSFDSRPEVFLGGMGLSSSLVRRPHFPIPLGLKRDGFACLSTYRFRLPIPSGCRTTLPRHPTGQTPNKWCRNFHLLTIGYAFRPRLRIRLTLGGLTFPRKP